MSNLGLTAGITNEQRASTVDKIEEFYKCKNDPQYFIENYVILELPGQSKYMKLYEPQERFMNSLLNDHHVIALKSRQIGISTIVQAFITYVVTFYDNVVIGVVSRDGDESTDFCRRVMSLIKMLPAWIQPKFVKDSERTFILDNGCKFFASQVSLQNPGKLFRGKPVTIAVIDEAAHIEKIDEAFVGFGPSLFKSQKVARENDVPFGTIVISTPNKTTGIGRWFYNRWVKANEPGSIYKPHSIHWSEVKEFRDDPNWYREQCQILENDPIAIAQELEMQFVASSNSFFPPDIIERLNLVKQTAYTKIEIEKHMLKIWDKPRQDTFYLIGVDSASASGNDFQTVEVFDFISFEQVAEYRSKMRVDEFCKAVSMINRIFPRNIMVVESNSYGNQVVEHLTKTGSNFNVYQQKIKRDVTSKPRYRYGLSTNAVTRPLILDALYTYVKENPSLVKSSELALELIGLERKSNGKVEAGPGMNDDLALALGFVAYVRMYDPPMSVSAAAAEHAIEDIIETVDMNFNDRGLYSGEVSSLRFSNELEQNRTNKALNRHVKANLKNLMDKEGSTIDMTKILGFNIMTNSRDD